MAAALVFDFDGTIVETEWPAYTAARELWQQHGLDITVDEWAWRIGTAGHVDPFTELQQRLGRDLDAALQRARIDRKNALTDAQPLQPGVRAWLLDARRLGVPVGIASSSPSTWIEHHLTRLGVRENVTCLACVDVHPPKPDPTSYRHAVETLGADPDDSVAVEDSEHGVNAAADAGLFVVAVPHALTAHMDLSRADVVVDSLAELSLEDALERARRRRQRP